MDSLLKDVALGVLDCVDRLEVIDKNMAFFIDKLSKVEDRLDELELKFGTELSKPKTVTSAS